MFSYKLIQSGLDDLKKITRADFCLLDMNLLVVAGTFERFDVNDSLQTFAGSEAASQDVKGQIFQKISGDKEEKYILVTSAGSGDGYMLSRIAASEIKHLMKISGDRENKDQLYSDIFSGQILYKDILIRAKKLGITEDGRRAVFIVSVDSDSLEVVKEMLSNLFSDDKLDYVSISNDSIVVIKHIDENAVDIESIAYEIVSMINTELLIVARASYGQISTGLRDIYDSYRQAMVAEEVGRIFFQEKTILSYSHLGIGRIIYGMTSEMCQMFLDEVYGANGEKKPSDEDIELAELFFDNNLSIADTSRVMDIARSTLVYRLDRIEKKLGLDIRKFTDAITLKIAIMVSRMNVV